MTDRAPVPHGRVSTIRGYWQAPALTMVTVSVLAMSIAGVALPNSIGRALSGTSVAVVVATPILRVAWLVFRWWQERDRRFILIGMGLLLVAATGAMLAATDPR